MKCVRATAIFPLQRESILYQARSGLRIKGTVSRECNICDQIKGFASKETSGKKITESFWSMDQKDSVFFYLVTQSLHRLQVTSYNILYVVKKPFTCTVFLVIYSMLDLKFCHFVSYPVKDALLFSFLQDLASEVPVYP